MSSSVSDIAQPALLEGRVRLLPLRAWSCSQRNMLPAYRHQQHTNTGHFTDVKPLFLFHRINFTSPLRLCLLNASVKAFCADKFCTLSFQLACSMPFVEHYTTDKHATVGRCLRVYIYLSTCGENRCQMWLLTPGLKLYAIALLGAAGYYRCLCVDH